MDISSMTCVTKRHVKIGVELLSLGGLLLFHFITLSQYLVLSFGDLGTYTLTVIGFSLVVPLVGYGFIRLVMPAVPTACSICYGLSLVTVANKMKMAETGSPISFTDLTNTGNFSVIPAYLPLWEILAIATPLLVFMTCYVWSLARQLRHRPLRPGLHLLALFIFSYGSTVFGGQVSPPRLVNSVLASSGIEYLNWGWRENVLKNGLYIHLMQTSVASLPDSSTADEKEEFAASSAKINPLAGRSRHVVMILCEACWHDDHNFKPLFAPLISAGMKEFRAVAPIFGGGTVNSDFEMITGLPANNRAVSGVIYQEYHRLISPDSRTLASHLKESGWTTAAMHNNTKTFWFRNEVMPKMGYSVFLGLEDMAASPTGGWPDDAILYSKAREFLGNQPASQPVFLMLSTVSTHGEFIPSDGDSGEGDYARRLGLAIAKAADFVTWLRQKDPTVTVILFGDHKPAMPKYLIDHQVLGEADFTKLGPAVKDFLIDLDGDWERIGDVPAYILAPNQDAVDAFVSEANHKPLFCVSELFNRYFAAANLPTYRYTAEVCASYPERGYKRTVAAMPPWLYSIALFGE